MRRGHTRLALPTAVLLLSVACTSNGPDQSSPAPAEPQAPASSTDASGTEAVVVPQDQTSFEAPAGTPTVEARPSPRPAAETGRVAADRPGPPAPTARGETTEGDAPAARTEASARDAGTVARDAARETPRPEPTRMISIPTDTRLPLALQTDLASDTSHVEDRVSARVTSDVVVEDEVVIPEGSRLAGRVTYAEPSGKVKGRAGLTVRFYSLTVGSQTYDIATEPVRRVAEGSKAKDVRNIGIGAGAGAVIGGLLGGRKGAGIGAAVGGAGGTGVALATKGEEVRLPAGTSVTTRLAEPLVVQAQRSGAR